MNRFPQILIVPIFGGLFLLAPSPPLPAKEAPTSYLPAGAVDGINLIGPPPPLNSTAFQTQLQIVLWLQQTRTPEQVAFVQTPLDVARFAPILKEELLTVQGKALKALLDDVVAEIQNDYDQVKEHYDVPRPFIHDQEVKPVMDARDVPSYPSGHAIRAIVWALLLSDLFPEKKEALMKLAYQVGYGRVIGGLHYPMDVLAGQKLGRAYADAVLKNPGYQRRIAEIVAPLAAGSP